MTYDGNATFFRPFLCSLSAHHCHYPKNGKIALAFYFFRRYLCVSLHSVPALRHIAFVRINFLCIWFWGKTTFKRKIINLPIASARSHMNTYQFEMWCVSRVSRVCVCVLIQCSQWRTLRDLGWATTKWTRYAPKRLCPSCCFVENENTTQPRKMCFLLSICSSFARFGGLVYVCVRKMAADQD